MKEHRDEKGRLVAIETGRDDDKKVIDEKPPADLAYLRPCIQANRFPAEVYIKANGTDHYWCPINRNQLQNMLVTGQSLLREFDRRMPEDTEVE